MQGLIPDPEKALPLFPVKDHDIKFGGADLYPSRFTLSCELL